VVTEPKVFSIQSIFRLAIRSAFPFPLRLILGIGETTLDEALGLQRIGCGTLILFSPKGAR
jgi:hypothetical protein